MLLAMDVAAGAPDDCGVVTSLAWPPLGSRAIARADEWINTSPRLSGAVLTERLVCD